MQYAKRRIDITFNLGTGTFGEEKGSDITISGHRISVSLASAGGVENPYAQFRIFGLSLDVMNKLSRVGWRMSEYRANSVLIAAGEDGGAMSVVHRGYIETAYANFNSAPEIVFEGTSSSGLIAAIRPVKARSYIGATDAGDVMEDLAKDINARLERNGVSVILQNPYFPGTVMTQIQACATAARLEYTLDRGILAIWKRDESRKTDKPIRIAPDTGMVGYPTYNAKGIAVRSLFNPDVINGKIIEVDTELTPAKGKWKVFSVFQSLESETPNGAWFTDMLCSKDMVNE